MGIILKSPQEIERMRKAGKIVAIVLQKLKEAVRPGIKTKELDKIAYKEITKRGAIPSFKNYRGYPASICTSVNEEVVHGIPGNRIIKEGDIISIDVGAKIDGFHGDAAITLAVGNLDREAEEIIHVTQQSLFEGIAAVKAGTHLGDVSSKIQQFVEGKGFSVVREYVGHGIGRDLHEEPQVPNFGTPGEGHVLQEGMVFALEPMVNAGVWQTKVLDNNWTVVTADGKLSAHFEHTIALGNNGVEILTQV